MASYPIQAALYFIRKRKRVEQNPVQTGSIEATFLAAGPEIQRLVPGDFEADGFEVGMEVTVEGAVNAANNGLFLLTAVTQTAVVVDRPVVNESATDGVRIARILAG